MLFTRFKGPLAKIALALAGMPVLLILALYGYAFLARVYLGHWPSFNNPDPRQMGWWFLHGPLQMGFMTFPFWLFAAISLAILGRSRSRGFPIGTILVTAPISWIAFIIFSRTDPGGFYFWFWD
jgi:hypothetical protein